jgi:hypothetical protein
MVRKSVPFAIERMKELQSQIPILSNLDFNTTSDDEMKILSLAAYIHDIGKVSATKIDDDGKISSVQHQDEKHFLPQLEKFKDVASPELKDLYLKNKDLLDFVTQHHMDLTTGSGFGKKFQSKWVDQEGKFKNDQKIKILLLLMMADKMGRGAKDNETLTDVRNKGYETNRTGIQATNDRAKKIIDNIKRREAKKDETREEFIKRLQEKGTPSQSIDKAVEQRYGNKDQ